MIARALLVEPRLLIADGPASMLDASLRATVLNLLLERNMAILFITHDIGHAAYVSDRMLSSCTVARSSSRAHPSRSCGRHAIRTPGA
jgi:peptide/nickel transport system ATP-binding protein